MNCNGAARPGGANPGPDFWAWSIDRYRRPGVEALSLRLQDDFGLNVNILLWACWCAERFDALPASALRHACDLTAPWRENVTAPLRHVRRDLKGRLTASAVEDLRAQIKTAELAAEKIEQSMLETAAERTFPLAQSAETAEVRSRALHNLTNYATIASVAERNGFHASLLRTFVDRIFDDGRSHQGAPI